MESGHSVSRWTLLAFAFVLISGRAFAAHNVFSSSVDRFEVDGNAFGPHDGTLDFVDEFDNGTIAPDWVSLLGTNVESGGVVTLKNPGFDITIGTAVLDVSNIENEVEVEDGAGDVTASSYWIPTLPTGAAEFHFQLYGVGATIESAGLSVGNGTTGPVITEQLTQVVFPSSLTNLINESVAINPGDITGQIVLRLAVDDANNTATGSFSLDGGSTFQSPFSPMPIFDALSGYEFLLGAGVQEGAGPATPTRTPTSTPTPTPLPTPQQVGAKLLMLKNPSGATARKVVYKVKQFGPSLAGNPFGTGATFNLQVDASSQCFTMPPYLWTATSSGYKYLDRTGAYGPVKSAKIRRRSNGLFQIKIFISGQLGAINIIPPNPGFQGFTNFSLGDAEYCSSTAGGAIVPNNAKTFKAKNAPPPLACSIPACP